jgi:hypothetical protein
MNRDQLFPDFYGSWPMKSVAKLTVKALEQPGPVLNYSPILPLAGWMVLREKESKSLAI